MADLTNTQMDIPRPQHGAVQPQQTETVVGGLMKGADSALSALDKFTYNSAIDQRQQAHLVESDLAAKTFALTMNANNALNVPPSTVAATDKLNSTKAGVDQGMLPTVAYQTQMQNTYAQEIANNPKFAADIVQYARQNGHEAVMFQQLDAQQARQKALETGNDQSQAFGVDYAKKNGYADSNLPLDQLAKIGLDLSFAKDQQQQAVVAAQAARSNYELSRQQREDALKQNNVEFMAGVQKEVVGRVNPFYDTARTLIGNIPGDKQEAVIQTQVLPLLDNVTAQAKASAKAHLAASGFGTEENYKTVDNLIDTQAAGIKAVFADKSGGLQKTLENLKTQYGIDTARAAPVIFKLGSLIGNNNVAAILGPTSMLDKNIQAQVAKEWQGLAASGSIDGQQHMANIVSLLNGNSQLKDYSPEDGAKYVGALATGKKASEAAIIQGTADHKDPHVWLNSVSNLTNAAHQLTPATSVNSLVQAANLLATQGTRQTLDALAKDPSTAEYAQSVGMASHLTAVKLLQNFREHAPEGLNKFQVIDYNDKTGQYYVKFDSQAFRASPAFSSENGGYSLRRQALYSQVPSSVQQQVNAMNQVLDHATKTSKYDTDLPKTANPLDIRNAIVTGRPLEKKGDDATKKWETSEAALENKARMFPQIIQAQDIATSKAEERDANMKPATPEQINSSIASIDENAGKFAPKSISKEEFTDLARAVAYQESRLNPDAVSPTGVRGVMQLTKGTAAMYKLNRDNPDENIQGGVRYLSHLVDAHHGDVNAALMEYNGGSDPIYDKNVLRWKGKVKPVNIKTASN